MRRTPDKALGPFGRTPGPDRGAPGRAARLSGRTERTGATC
ncbi:hypothetical protein [Brevundimonas sp.]|nr:hypothetical protein [Brevundimonas sp.]